VETPDSVLTAGVPVGTVLRIPINHFEGSYICDAGTLAELRGEDRVVLRYVDNPNGSVDDIAGICNPGRNVVGLMPHPERASDPLLGSVDGLVLLRALLATAAGPDPAGDPAVGPTGDPTVGAAATVAAGA
jgi:phosphoribosylformylglycinamidine synthase